MSVAEEAVRLSKLALQLADEVVSLRAANAALTKERDEARDEASRLVSDREKLLRELGEATSGLRRACEFLVSLTREIDREEQKPDPATTEQLWKDPDWNCPACHCTNFAIRGKCRQCGWDSETVSEGIQSDVPEPNAKGVSAEAARLPCKCCGGRKLTPTSGDDCSECGGSGFAGGTFKDRVAQSPDPQFTDRERLDWVLFQASRQFLASFIEDGGPTRGVLDAAMLSAGLRPKRESVTMGSLISIWNRMLKSEPFISSGIRAILDTCRASDGTMKQVED